MHWIWHGCSLLQKIQFGQPVCRLLRLECAGLKTCAKVCHCTIESSPRAPSFESQIGKPRCAGNQMQTRLECAGRYLCRVCIFFCSKTQTLGLRSCSLMNMFSYECLCKGLGGIHQNSTCWLHLLDLHETFVCGVTRDTSFMKQPIHIYM